MQPAANEAPAKAARICAANSAALRQHFTALTSAFLDPLLPFCTPPASEGDAPASPLASFSHAAFLDGLDRRKLAAALMERFSSQVPAAACRMCQRHLSMPAHAVQGEYVTVLPLRLHLLRWAPTISSQHAGDMMCMWALEGRLTCGERMLTCSMIGSRALQA